MVNFKQIIAVAALAFGVCAPAMSQRADNLDYKPAPYMFVGIQGGAQTTFTNFDQLKLITPTASVSFGAFFTPTVGARLHVNGLWNKGGINPGDFKYNYKYATTDLDLLLNLCTMFGCKDYYPLNVYLIGGVGLNYAWDNDDLVNSAYDLPFAWEKNRLSHNARVGAMLDYNIAKHWSVNFEVSANSLGDRYNSKVSAKDDWQLTAQVGVAYKFGFKQKPTPVPVKQEVAPKPVEVVPATPIVQPEPKPEVKPEPKPEPKKLENLKKDVFFVIAKSDVKDKGSSTIKEIVQWMKAHPTATATITGHADAGTGNPTINAKYAADRAQAVKEALVSAGIEANRLSTDSKGDRVMPYGDNENSRVAIVIAAEK